MDTSWKTRGSCQDVHLRGNTVGPYQNMTLTTGSSGTARKEETSSATESKNKIAPGGKNVVFIVMLIISENRLAIVK